MASPIFGRKLPKGIWEEMLYESQKEVRLILQPWIFFSGFLFATVNCNDLLSYNCWFYSQKYVYFKCITLMFNAYMPIFVLQYCLANSFGLFVFIYLTVVFCVLLFWPTHSYERDGNLISSPDLLLTTLRFRQQEIRVRDDTKLYGNSKLEKSSNSQFFQGVVCVYIKCSTFSRCLEICALTII